ncbi:MAG: Sua5/YciO/YrdC/YwlC family protein [Hymenobacter sp.]
MLLTQQVILYPTDTVWGLGCDAEVPRAVEKAVPVEGAAPAGQPSIVLVADLAMLARYAVTRCPPNSRPPWPPKPRPTTYLLPASRAVAPGLVAPDGTVGLRVTQDEFCHRVVRRLGHGLVSTSANKTGEPTPAVYAEVDPAIVRGVDHAVTWRQRRPDPHRALAGGAPGSRRRAGSRARIGLYWLLANGC